MRTWLLAGWLATTVGVLSETVPFVLPWDDAAPGATDLSSWNAPIDEASRLGTDAAGHFVVAGRRVRLLGVNLASDSPFVPTNKADAMAARLAKFGINAVRFHHIDASWAVGGGLIRYTSTGSRQLNAGQLERIHYLVSRLAARGIYSDFNLLTAREYRSGDGLGGEVTGMDWKDQHLLAMFDDDALQLQQEFATRLLTPTNRFTGRSLAADPSVAFVEILNENGLLQKWYEGALDRLPTRYGERLRARWNDWLAARYADDAALRSAWKAVDLPLGANLVRNGTFASGTTGWTLEQHAGAAATAVRTADFDGAPSVKLTVTRTGGAGWHVQFNQPNLRVTEGKVYTLTFSVRASVEGPLDLAVMMAHDPWQPVGLSESVSAGTGWRTFVRTFVATRTDANVRVNFGGIGTRLMTLWLADVRLQEGGEIGRLPEGASLAARSIPTIRREGEGFGGTAEARRDWLRFARDVENRYYDAMVTHLRTSVGYPGLIFGTIMANSPAGVQSRLDVIDAHAYWQHPVFPGTPWDSTNWYVPNRSLVNAAPSETTLAGLARQRLRGKPFTVTEYQHPSPNSYGAEGPILLGAYAALQDWDGLWMFDYGWGNDASVSGSANPMGRIRGYFDTAQHPTKMANLMLAAALFRRGDVRPALREYVLPLNPETEIDLLERRAGSWNVFSGAQLDLPGALALVSRVGVEYGPDARGLAAPPAAPTVFDSDTGELHWQASDTAGWVTVNTARTRAAVGFLAGKSVDTGDVRFEFGTNRLGWATVGLMMTRGDSPAAGGTALLVATGDCENTGQVWRSAARESLSHWGTAPTRIEVVPFRLTLPAAAARVRAWALDERGQRRGVVEVKADGDGRAVIIPGPAAATVWYEIEIDPPARASFEDWRRRQFTAAELAEPSISGAGASPAGDGVPNLLKYATGREAKVPANGSELMQWGVEEGAGRKVLWLAYPRRRGLAEVSLRPYFSDALPGWNPAVERVEVAGDEFERVRVEQPIPPGVPAVGLLKVELRSSDG